MIDLLLTQLKKYPGCISFPPASQTETTQTTAVLRSYGLAPIPQDYTDFLFLSNGLIVNGIELAGSLPHHRPQKNYIFPDLLQINRPYTRHEYFKGRLLLGSLSESLIIYDETNRLYTLKDRINLRSRLEVGSTAEVLQIILNLCRFSY